MTRSRTWRNVGVMSLLSQLARDGPRSEGRSIAVGRTADGAPSPPLVLRSTPSRPANSRWLTDAACRIGTALLGRRDVTERELAQLEADVDEQVEVWTPSMNLHSRFDLVATLTSVDDAIDDFEVAFTESVASPPIVLLEWMATGRFTRPAFLDDDELIEPTGTVIRVGGALSLSFDRGQRATRICCYYDRLALIEQMLYG